MKQFFKDKQKLLMMTIFLLVVLVACSSPRDPETGKVYAEKLIGLDTSFGSQLNNGWFDGIIVWPIAQLINLIAQYSDAGIGIIVVTLLLQFITAAFTIKSQVSAQRIVAQYADDSARAYENPKQIRRQNRRSFKNDAGAGDAAAVFQIQNQSVRYNTCNLSAVSDYPWCVSGNTACTGSCGRLLPKYQPDRNTDVGY